MSKEKDSDRLKFTEYQKTVQSAVRSIRSFQKMEPRVQENFLKMDRIVEKLRKIVAEINEESAAFEQQLKKWVDEKQKSMQAIRKQAVSKFGAELDDEMKKRGKTLSGQYPELRAGLFTIELNVELWKAIIWYGPKKEKQERCPMAINRVVRSLEALEQGLGSKLSIEDFLEKLSASCKRVLNGEKQARAPIIGVLAEMAYCIQDDRFLNDPKRENFRSYSRADFSYDLFRIGKTSLASRFRLVVASRMHTSRRSEHLWIPNNDKGKGASYSHLEMRR